MASDDRAAREPAGPVIEPAQPAEAVDLVEPVALRAALAASWALVAATFLYGLIRGIQKVLFPEANPAAVIWSAHAGYFWRIWIVLYASGMVGLLVFRLARGNAAMFAKHLRTGVLVASAVLAVQGILVP